MEPISTVVSIVSLLCSCIGGDTCRVCKLKDNQESLRIGLQELKNKWDDVKRRVDSAEGNPNEPMKCTEEVKGWLVQVQSIEEQVDKVLRKFDQHIRGKCLGNYCPLNCWSRYKLGKLVVRNFEYVNTFITRGSFAEVAYRLPPAPVQEIPVDVTVGMESMLEKVLKLLSNDEIKILGLYGTGGVGKTTLLTRVNNEFQKRAHDFDVIIWVVVSKPLNIANVQKQIGERLGLSDENQSAINISSALKNKKFLLLLDDLWQRVDLPSIGIPAPENNSNSKIVLTTRLEDVCTSVKAKMVRVDCLKWNEAWSLFRKNVGDEKLYSDTQILGLAEAVAKECAGLPLALITIGRAMSNKKKPQEWRNAVTTLKKAASEFQGMDDQVLPLLKLSYDSLQSNTIQACFLYCSLYPEDYSIDVPKLIDYWIVEGLLEGFDDITDEARNRAHDVIGCLKSACLLENDYAEGGEQFLKMHDVIRDLALWIVSYGKRRNKFVVEQGVDLSRLPEPFKEWKDAERINLFDCEIDTFQTGPPSCPHLSTLILTYDRFNKTRTASPISHNFFQYMPSLKVLDLSENMELHLLPTSITGLGKLEYLNLSFTKIKKLPVELKNLVKLKYLDLRGTEQLQEILPGILPCLSKLQLLQLGGGFKNWKVKEEEGGLSLGELHSLKYLVNVGITVTAIPAVQRLLSNFHTCITSLGIEECKDLRSLGLSPSTTTTTLSLGRMKILRYLSCLRCTDLEELRIDWMPTEDQETGLVSSLELLDLYDLPKLNSIVWDKQMAHVARGCFINLYQININGCNALKDLTWLVCLRNLKTLVVSYCDRIEEIIVAGFEDGGGDELLDFFKRLKFIRLWRLPLLKSICNQSFSFPCLEVIAIAKCPELKKLPLDSTSNAHNTLKHIFVETDLWNQLQWADEISEDIFRPYYVGLSDDEIPEDSDV